MDGINRIDALPEYIKSIGQDSISLTDHGNVAGTYSFYKACKKVGIKPILGMESYYCVGDRHIKEVDPDGERYYHLILLAHNNTGLHNLFKLSSFSYTEGFYAKPRLDDDLLAQHNEGLLATTSCLGSRFSQLILNNRTREAEQLIDHHTAIFKNRFFVELQLHENQEQQKVNKILIDIASRKDLPLILTNDAHYTHQSDKTLHEIALCMQTNDRISNPDRFSFGDIDVHVATHDWMWARAEQQGIPYEAISNTQWIADAIDANSYFSDRRNRYPGYKFLPEGITSWEALENLSKSMLSEKFNGLPPREYRDRLTEELLTIKKMGFSDYMLIVWDFINGAREIDCMVGPGRGSAAGSLVAFAIGITQVDPIKYNLLFQRFLNQGRAATPLIFNQDIETQIKPTCKSGHSHP